MNQLLNKKFDYHYRFLNLLRDDLLLIHDQVRNEQYRVPIKQLVRFESILRDFSNQDQNRILALSRSK